MRGCRGGFIELVGGGRGRVWCGKLTLSMRRFAEGGYRGPLFQSLRRFPSFHWRLQYCPKSSQQHLPGGRTHHHSRHQQSSACDCMSVLIHRYCYSANAESKGPKPVEAAFDDEEFDSVMMVTFRRGEETPDLVI